MSSKVERKVVCAILPGFVFVEYAMDIKKSETMLSTKRGGACKKHRFRHRHFGRGRFGVLFGCFSNLVKNGYGGVWAKKGV